jgi:hypothetical protein
MNEMDEMLSLLGVISSHMSRLHKGQCDSSKELRNKCKREKKDH